MDIQIQETVTPDYKRIYSDIISQKYPEKKEKCMYFLKKENLSVLDVIKINKMVFEKNEENHTFNQKCRSYNTAAILEILEYQKKNQLNNTQLAKHFHLSRNTVAKWKNIYC